MGRDDAFDDDGPDFLPPLPPEDRLWRHPAEVGTTRIVPIDVPPGGRSPWAVGFVSAIGGVLLAGSLMFGVGGVGKEPAQLALRPLATLAPRVVGTATAVNNTAGRSDRSYIVGIDVVTATDVRTGQGVIVRDDGHIVTSATLVAGATDMRVVLADGSIRPGIVLGVDTLNDVAVIKIAVSTPVAPLAVDGRAAAGDPALVVGGSRGARGPGWKTTISSVDAHLADGSCDVHGAIQLVGVLDPTASGAAVIDSSETVIGMSAGPDADAAGSSYAVPARTLRAVTAQIIANGTVHHGWLGVEGLNATPDQAKAAGVTGGAAVRRVIDNSPAATIGLTAEDIIVSLDGEPVSTMSNLVVIVREHQPGENLVVEYARGGETHRAEVTLGEIAKV